MSYYGNAASLALHRKRIQILGGILACFFAILVARVWYLQILQGNYFRSRSERQRIRTQRILAPRGEFVDRNGVVLVDTRPGYNVTITLEDAPDPEDSLERLAALLEIPAETLLQTLAAAREEGVRVFQPIRLLSNVEWETVALLEAHQMDLPGISVSPEPLRNYRYGPLCAHLFGYMGEINREELKREVYRDYRIGDVIGKTGLEKRLEPFLRGVDGERSVEVNSVGRIIEDISLRPPVPGNRAVLTLDGDVQRALEEAFGDHSGAGVALNPNNGEILAMASRPAYDPNLFSGGIAKEQWDALVGDPKHPLTDKAIYGQYPPGSVFKIVLAIGGLEERVITPRESVTCRGHISFGGRRYRCWKKYGHGRVDLHRALVESCDVYFYELGQRLGIDGIAAAAKNLGLGRLARIALEGERPGLIPSRDWKHRARGEPWYPGETLSVSIGQGYVLVTPIQLAGLISAVGNGGTIYRPHLVRRIENYQGVSLKEFPPEVLHDVPISARTLGLVRRALEGVVAERHGTGGRARIAGVRVGGKTGTAQVVRMKQEEEEEEALSERFQDHGLFVAFAPVERPEIAVAVVVEHGGHGGSVAAPIARQVMAAYFRKTGRIVELAGEK